MSFADFLQKMAEASEALDSEGESKTTCYNGQLWKDLHESDEVEFFCGLAKHLELAQVGNILISGEGAGLIIGPTKRCCLYVIWAKSFEGPLDEDYARYTSARIPLGSIDAIVAWDDWASLNKTHPALPAFKNIRSALLAAQPGMMVRIDPDFDLSQTPEIPKDWGIIIGVTEDGIQYAAYDNKDTDDKFHPITLMPTVPVELLTYPAWFEEYGQYL